MIKQAVPYLPHARPPRHMDAGKRTSAISPRRGQARHSVLATGFLARRIRFGEARDRDKASVFDTEPPRPVGQVQLADIGHATVGFPPDELVYVDGLTLSSYFVRSSFRRFHLHENRRRQAPACMHEPLFSISRVADDRPHLVGVHLIGRYQVDQNSAS